MLLSKAYDARQAVSNCSTSGYCVAQGSMELGPCSSQPSGLNNGRRLGGSSLAASRNRCHHCTAHQVVCQLARAAKLPFPPGKLHCVSGRQHEPHAQYALCCSCKPLLTCNKNGSGSHQQDHYSSRSRG